METMSSATEAKYHKPPVCQGFLDRFPQAIAAVAEVSRWGTEKHEVPLDDVGFLNVPDAYNVYRNAEVRHMLAEAEHGPLNGEDGMLLHAAQRAWNAMAALEVLVRRLHKDNEAGLT